MTEKSTAKTTPVNAPPGAPPAGLGELGSTTSSRGWLALTAAALVVVGALTPSRIDLSVTGLAPDHY